jgi:hypothetical protein
MQPPLNRKQLVLQRRLARCVAAAAQPASSPGANGATFSRDIRYPLKQPAP